MTSNLAVNRGITMIEALIVITIMGILLAMAVPNFTLIIRDNRLTTSANTILASLNLARSEAIKRGQEIVVRKKGANWEDGWQIFIDIDRTPVTDANVFNDNAQGDCQANEDCLLKEFSALPTNFKLRGSNNLGDFIRYTSSGISNHIPDGLVGNDYFVICDTTDGGNAPKTANSRLININTVGRPSLGQDTNNDGIPNLDIAVTMATPNTNITTCTP